MANYRSVHVKFWRNPGVRKLSGIARAVFLFLFTSDARNESCLYSIPVDDIVRGVGFSDKQVRSALQDLIDAKFIEFDFEREVVWVINAMKFQGMNEKCKTSARKDFEMCSSPVLQQTFFQKNKDFLGLDPNYLSTDTHSNGYPMGIESVSNGHLNSEYPPIGIGLGLGIGIGLGLEGGLGETEAQPVDELAAARSLENQFDQNDFVTRIMPYWKASIPAGHFKPFHQTDLFKWWRQHGTYRVMEAVYQFRGGYKKFAKIGEYLEGKIKLSATQATEASRSSAALSAASSPNYHNQEGDPY